MEYECKNCRHGVFFNVDQSWLCNGGIAPEDPVKRKRYCEVVYTPINKKTTGWVCPYPDEQEADDE